MGWDYVSYGGRHAHLHDMQIWALRHFLADAAGVLAAEEPGLVEFEEAREFFAAWEWPGPGVVTGTSLDDYVRGSPQRERVLVRVCGRAADRLRAFGEVVPLGYFQAHANADSPGGVYTSGQPSAALIRGVGRIRGLLAPDAESFAASEPET